MLIQEISTWITSVIVSSGYLGIAGLSLVGSAAIPIPSEVVMPFAGFLVSQGHFNILYVALAAAVGSTLGSLILYAVGYYGGKEFIEKYGKYILMSQHDVARAEKFFERHGNIANFIGRFIPVLRTYISLPAGIARNRPWQFVLYAFLGSFIWSFVLAYIGYKFGQRWDVASAELSRFSDGIVVVIAVALAYYVYRHVRSK
jgi:membrane protein DedA with SNARE-associated domain